MISQKELMQTLSRIADTSAEVGLDVFDSLCEFFEGFVEPKSVTIACNPLGLAYKRHLEWEQRERRLRDTIRRLEKKRLIATKKTAEGIEIALTKAGKSERLREKLRRCRKRLPTGCRCYVMFDIPEDVANTRKRLRRFLKKAGFTRMQRSVWTSPFDVAEEMTELVRSMGCARWVSVVIGKTLAKSP